MYEKMGGSDPLANVSDIANAIITIGAEVAGTEDKRMARATSCQSQPRTKHLTGGPLNAESWAECCREMPGQDGKGCWPSARSPAFLHSTSLYRGLPSARLCQVLRI